MLCWWMLLDSIHLPKVSIFFLGGDFYNQAGVQIVISVITPSSTSQDLVMEAAVEDRPRCVFCSHVPVDWNVQQTEGDGVTLHFTLKNCSKKKHGKKQAKNKS